MNEALQHKATAMLKRMGLADVETAKRLPGRGSAVTPEEADDIRWSYVAEGKSISEIARHTGRTRETISGIVKDVETDALRKELREMKRARAKQILAASTDKAAEKWVSAMDAAAEKGRHEPMRDLLLHEEVIKPIAKEDSGPGIVVQIGCASADVVVQVGQAPAIATPDPSQTPLLASQS